MAIRFSEVSLGYSKSDAVKNFSAVIPKSRITVLLGQNGSGKTTVLRALVKYLKPRTGSIHFGSRNLADIKIEELPIYVSYSPSELDDHVGMSALNVVSSAKRGRRWLREDEAREALERLNIGYLSGKSFNEMSTGQRRLVLIARSLAAKTPIILMDEPTSGLDPSNKQRIMRVIRGMSSKKLTVVIATQDLDVALESDWVIAIKEGKVSASGPSESVMTSGTLSKLYDSRIRVERFKNTKIIIFGKRARR
jgi:ABC-type cobalamin/Fe3+-siderophores transport system ATPase subunit